MGSQFDLGVLICLMEPDTRELPGRRGGKLAGGGDALAGRRGSSRLARWPVGAVRELRAGALASWGGEVARVRV